MPTSTGTSFFSFNWALLILQASCTPLLYNNVRKRTPVDFELSNSYKKMFGNDTFYTLVTDKLGEGKFLRREQFSGLIFQRQSMSVTFQIEQWKLYVGAF